MSGGVYCRFGEDGDLTFEIRHPTLRSAFAVYFDGSGASGGWYQASNPPRDSDGCGPLRDGWLKKTDLRELVTRFLDGAELH